MHRRLRIAGALLAVAGLTAVAACGGPAGGGEAPRNQLTILWAADATDLSTDNGLGLQVNAGVHERLAIYDALVALTPTADIEYRLAESLTPDGPTRWTLTLKPGLRFSDGTPLDAAAVKFNWERLADPATKAPSAQIAQQIAGLDVVDERTLAITLKEPNGQFPTLVAQSALTFIGSPTAMQADPAGFGSNPVGAGAYVLKEWVRNDHSVFEKSPTSAIEAPVDRIEVRILADETQRYNTLAAGGGDVDFTINANTAAKAEKAGHQVVTGQTDGGLSLQFNTAKPPFDDVRARRAVALAFDGAALGKSVFSGLVEVPETLMRAESKYFADVPLTRANREQAQALLDELAAEGEPVSFTILTPLNFQQVAEWFQSSVSGYRNLTVQVEAAQTTGQQLFAGDFDATLIGLTRFIDPYPALVNFVSSGGSTNFGKYSDPAVDAAARTIVTSTDEAERIRAFADLQARIAEDLPFAGPFYRMPNWFVLAEGIDAAAVPILNDGVIDLTRFRP
ncbi:peptide/nickel transport system substrate-binding protein [Pseudonocardia thermophila]|jgi:ABC-type dipeptide transport system, periplasmic component|uniref:Peptide/nickel transport system substrate-binding protein n=1 Tax=Pseudonocardia thermophila TaxID=1848 RepID=A0A1M6UY86_PSETH|nr:ABC transporter substrate-binding protein [Pseudonocardia thermophila]SHK74219.1 peptide/nickel transport system substrate-binding protein [Pseudonocardia thermophila]